MRRSYSPQLTEAIEKMKTRGEWETMRYLAYYGFCDSLLIAEAALECGDENIFLELIDHEKAFLDEFLYLQTICNLASQAIIDLFLKQNHVSEYAMHQTLA